MFKSYIYVLILNIQIISQVTAATVCQKKLQAVKLSCEQTSLKNLSVSAKKSHELINKYEPNSKNIKKKLIQNAVFEIDKNIKFNECDKSISNFEKQCENEIADLAVIKSDNDQNKKKNEHDILLIKNAYCRNVVMPVNEKISTKDISREKGCVDDFDLNFTQKVFEVCTIGSKTYNEQICRCHMIDSENSCFFDDNEIKKIATKINQTESVSEPLCKSPEEKSKSFLTKNDFLEIGKIILLAGGTIYAISKIKKHFKNKEKKSKELNSEQNNTQVLANQTKTNQNNVSLAGVYTGEISNGNPGKTWCDGSFPEGQADIKANPGNYSPDICTFGYGLFGTFTITVANDGSVSGTMQVIYGHNVHSIGGAHIGSGSETTFNYPGAIGRLKFNSDGTVSGRIWEPKGFLSGDRTELVGGVISGRKK